ILSQSWLSSVTGIVHSIRQPWVETSISRACALLLLPSRTVAVRFSAARLARLRSGCAADKDVDSAMARMLPRVNLRARGEQMVPVKRPAALPRAHFGSAARSDAREHVHRRGVERDTVVAAP